jgi:hypothetical protein
LTTPPTSPEEEERLRVLLLERSTSSNGDSDKPKKSFRVQFGSPQAAEYEIDGPSAQLTPLPSDVTRQRYSMEQKVVLLEEQELTQETKANSAVLAEWEEGFEELPRAASRGRRGKHKNRRDSGLFTPSPDSLSGSLYSQDGDDEMEERTPPRKPLAVETENTSPSMMVMENLASLRMSPMKREEAMLSPTLANDNDDDDDTFTLQNKENSWRRASDSSNLSSPSMNTSASDQSTVVTSPNHHGTAELVVNLQSIHSDGGAMDNTASPPARTHISSLTYDTTTTTAHAGETTPPPTNISLDTIHSFGGALEEEEELESPIDLVVQPSPRSPSVCLAAHKPEQANVSHLSNTTPNRKSSTDGALESAVSKLFQI